MSDPLSITASIVTLIHVSVQVTVLISQFCNEASAVDTTLAGLLGDVEGFKRVLESMKETINQDDIKSNLQSTGHTGSHWKNLARSLNDGTGTLQKLHDLLDGVNKKTSLLDTQRKLIRLKSASGQIAQYREQIQSSHTVLQLSLGTIILWNQVTFQKSTEKIPDKIVPTLDKLYDEFRSFGALLNAKVEKLQFAVVDPNDPDDYKLQYMTNLRECVRSAAEVVSTASTNLNGDSNDKISGRCGSDFGDIFVKDANEPMLRWFASNTVYEYEDVEAPISAPPETSTGDALTEYHSDTDSDIENDMIRSLFKEGNRRQRQGDLTGALDSLRRIKGRTVGAYYRLLLRIGLMDRGKSNNGGGKLQIIEHQVGKKDAIYLKDTMKLAEILMKNQDYVDAHLQARRSLRGFKKLGDQGHTDYERCLEFLIKICQLEGKEDEEEAYAALLSGHAGGVQRSTLKSQSAELDPAIIQPQLASTLDLQVEPNIAIEATKKMDKTVLQPHESVEENLPHTETEIVAFGGEDGRLLHPKKRVEASLAHSRSHSTETTLMEAKDDRIRNLDQESSSFSRSQPPTIDTTEDLKRRKLPTPWEGPFVPPSVPPSPSASIFTRDLEFHTPSYPDNPGYFVRSWRDESTSGENSPIRYDASDSSMRDKQYTGPGFIGRLLAKSYAALKGDKADRRAVASSSLAFPSIPRASYAPTVVSDYPDIHTYGTPSIQSWASKIPSHATPYDGSTYSMSPSFDEWDAYRPVSATPGGNNPPAYPGRTRCPICYLSFSKMTRDAAWLHEHSCLEGIYGAADLPQQNQEQQNRDRASWMSGLPILPAPSTLSNPIWRKMLLVGDTECGKACLARAWMSSQHSTPGSVTSAIPNTGKTVVNIRGCGIGLDVWDIGTAEDFSKTERQEILRRDFDGNTHVLLICVDINKPNDFVDTACTCNAKARDYFPDVPRVLVGCNNDLRLGTSERKNLKSQHIPPFASSWGHKLAASIHALAYFEVSKSDNQGSSDLFDFVGAYMLRYTVK